MAFPQVASITQSSFGTDATAHLVSMPATVAVDDLLVSFFTTDGNVTITTPTGWTLKSSTAAPAGVSRLGVYVKKADGSEGGTTVDHVTSGSEQATGQVYRILAADWSGTLSEVEVGTAVAGTSVSPDPPSLTPAGGAKDYLWIAVYGHDSGGTPSAYPTNYTNGTHTVAPSSSAAGTGTCRRELNGTVDDPAVFTHSISRGWSAQTLVVPPGGGAAIVTPVTVAAAVTCPTPLLTAASTVLTAIFLVVATLPTATLTAGAAVTPTAITATVTLPTPTLTAGATVTPVTVAASVTLPTVTVATAANVTPATCATTATLPTPTVAAGWTVTPATVAVAATLATPTIPGPPTVARDSFSERGSTFAATPNPATSSHTPVGTPRSVTVFIGHGVESTDLITGVTYGGVAMTRVPTNGFAQDTAGEPGAVYAYHLGSSIPTGTQTLSISHTGSTTAKWAIVVYHTASGDTEIVTSGKLEGDQANPQLALNTGATSAIRTCILYTGQDLLAGIAVLSGMEAVGVTSSHDFGAFIGAMGQQSTASTGSFTIGFDGASEDVAFIAVAIQETTPTRTPATVAVTAILPTPSIPIRVVPATVTAAATLPTPSITLSATRSPVTVAATVTLPTPTAAAAVTEQPATISRTVTIPTPTVIGGVSVIVRPATIGGDYFDMYGDPYGGAINVTIPTPTVLATSTTTPATVTVTATLPTPAVTVAVTVNPTVLPAVVTLPTPTVIGGVSAVVTPARVFALAALPTPTRLAGATVTPSTVTAVTTLPTPTLTAAVKVTPAVVPAVVTLPTPTVTGLASVTPTVIPLAVTLSTPLVVTGLQGLVGPAVIPVTATVPTPLISTPITVTPATVPVIVTISTPTVVGGVAGSATPTVLAVTATLPTATLNAGATVSPAVVPVTVTLPTPTIGLDATVTPTTVTVTGTLPTPTLRAAVTVEPAALAVLADVATPSVLGETTVHPLTVDLTATLATPTVIIGALFPPGFWTPDPIGYVKNPVGYTKVGPDDDPPWN